MDSGDITVEGCRCRYRVEEDDTKTITSVCYDHLTKAISAGLAGRSTTEYLAGVLVRKRGRAMSDVTKTEWTLVIDGDPRMDGTHERREVGRFQSLAEARRGYQTITVTMRLPSDEVRIEKREVGPWELVQPWEITNDILATESRDRDE